MEIRPAWRADRPAIEAVVQAAFASHGTEVVAMVRALDESGATRVSLVADDGEGIVGHVQLSRAWIDARARLVEALMLTPLSVAPDVQGRGTGTLLVAGALAAADALGAPTVVLEGSPVYYGARGFVDAEALGLLRPSARIPAPAFQVATLTSFEPWMTGRVVYPQSMWETDTVGLRDPELATIEDALRSSGD